MPPVLVVVVAGLLAAAAPAVGGFEAGPGLPPAVRDDVAARMRAVALDGSAGVGDVPVVRALISRAEVDALPDDGFIVRSGVVDGARAVAADGRGPRGKAYAAYALLEALGFRFLHPLAPTAPETRGPLPVIDDVERPRLRVRNVHLHTMHPIELTDLLEGAGDDASWAAMLPEWDAFLVWLVANRQNEVEWVLLDVAGDGGLSAARAARLRSLVARAHAFGVDVGVDAPIALTQQHGWRLMTRAAASLDEQRADIDDRLDVLFTLGFDFISTESGDTELTHPSAERMLAWMDEVAAHAAAAGKRARIKVHCSAGQSAAPFLDRHTGEPLDFNFLAAHADRRLGVEPHTVQMYALDDAAPVYGNRDFHAMRRFVDETAGGSREVVWYPESAYWVDVDVDVPLFLPVYAQARLHDLDLIEGDLGPGVLDGQSLFSSGWEWGYWLNDVVAARAAWSRPRDLEDALWFLPRDTAQAVAAVARDEHRLLVERNGIAWLSGQNPFGALLGTQARRPPVDDGVRALLADMDRTLAARSLAAGPGLSPRAAPLVTELADALAVTALRARHVRALVDGRFDEARAARAQALAIVRTRERAYRVPLARVAAWRPREARVTAYPYGYLYEAHTLASWRRDEDTFDRRPWIPCHGNLVDPVDVVVGPGLLAGAARAAGEALGLFPFAADAAACLAAPARDPAAGVE